MKIEPALMGAVLGTVAERADLCVKVLDREGIIRAVNDRGLAILQVNQEDFCGNVWTDLWSGQGQEDAINAVNRGFAGEKNSFSGTFRTGDGILRNWVVEVIPLDWQGSDVSRLLVISNDVTVLPAEPQGHDKSSPDVDLLIQMTKSSLHDLNNMVSTCGGAARIMTRNPDAEKLAQLSEWLHECSVRTQEMVAKLEGALAPLTKDDDTPQQ